MEMEIKFVKETNEVSGITGVSGELVEIDGKLYKVLWGFATGDKPGPRNQYGTDAKVLAWYKDSEEELEKQDILLDSVIRKDPSKWKDLVGFDLPRKEGEIDWSAYESALWAVIQSQKPIKIEHIYTIDPGMFAEIEGDELMIGGRRCKVEWGFATGDETGLRNIYGQEYMLSVWEDDKWKPVVGFNMPLKGLGECDWDKYDDILKNAIKAL